MAEFTNSPDRDATPREALEANFLATRVSFTWMGVRRALDASQNADIGQLFGAEGKFLSSAKKLLDTKHTAYRAVSSIKSQVVSWWKSISLPYPEQGIRLIRQDDLDSFEQQMTRFREQLDRAVDSLDSCYWELKQNARLQLGSLYNESDYPESVKGAFLVDWSLENVSPPDYLLTLRPELYEREVQRIRGQFEAAVAMAEDAFVKEMQKLVAHLADRLKGGENGKPQQFADSTVDNLKDFLERFKHLSVKSNTDLENLVVQADGLVKGVSADALRNYEDLGSWVGQQMEEIRDNLDGMMEDQPRRNIIRRNK